jgi:hypothetical protein
MRERTSDTGRMLWTERDTTALTWIANQDAIRLEHLQVLLSRLSHRPVRLSTRDSMAQCRVGKQSADEGQ